MAQDSYYEKKYTKPDLRRSLKEEIKQSDKGGKPGQWSARKSQLLVQEYEKRGGGYKQDEKDEAARSLEEWSDQDWQTEEGDERARKGDYTERYLPKAVWERLSDEEKREAERTKEKASKEGQQHVDWTPAIKRAMREAGYSDSDSESDSTSKSDLYERARELNVSGRSKMDEDELRQAIQEASQHSSRQENQKASKKKGSKKDGSGDSSSTKGDDLEQESKSDLYEQARELNISGRSKMDKDELIQNIREERSE
ncbi:MAG: Rho termination factor N-terminal domain-containing protein [Synechococcales bacterium]|nr:Rho termination factor N-terminal domain-containing protein [Synechococcales bacterium]